MTFSEIIQKSSETIIGAAVAGALGGAWWLVRQIFTNQKQVALLRQEMKSREEMRQRDRDDIAEVKADVKELRAHLLK